MTTASHRRQTLCLTFQTVLLFYFTSTISMSPTAMARVSSKSTIAPSSTSLPGNEVLPTKATITFSTPSPPASDRIEKSTFVPQVEVSPTPVNIPESQMAILPTALLTPTPTPAPSREEPYILFANRHLIRRVNLEGVEPEILINESGNAIAMDFDIRQNYMFWTYVGIPSIRRANLDGSNMEILVHDELTSPDGIAWDWINEKLYWSDPGQGEIEVYDPASGNRRRLIFTGDTSSPRGLAVDPTTRWLYWTDWGDVAKIERASMDGTSRKTLHNTSLVWPNAITVDYDTQTLYWADANLNKIETSGVDGSNRKVVTTAFIFHPFDITFYNGVLYWTDWLTDSILRTQISSPDNVDQLFLALDTEPMGLHVVTRERQPLIAENPCTSNSSNCSHFCLLSVSDPNGYTCSCPTGFTLMSNQRECNESIPTSTPMPSPANGSCIAAGFTDCCTEGDCLGEPPNCFCDVLCSGLDLCCQDFDQICKPNSSQTVTPVAVSPTPTPITPTPPSPDSSQTVTPVAVSPTPTPITPTPPSPEPYLLFANRRRIYQLNLNGSMLRTVVAGETNSIAVDFDYRKGYIYWTDVTAKRIRRAALNGTGARTVVDPGIEIPDGLAVDWINDKLYWTDATLKHIEVYDMTNRKRSIIIRTGNMTTPRGIVVDPCNRWMYWSDWGMVAKIEKASMDGKGRRVLHNTSLVWPNGIALDYELQILYWADANLDKVESSSVDGSNRRTITVRGIFHPFSLTVFGDTLFLTDWILDQVLSVRLAPTGGSRTNTTMALTSTLRHEPMGIQVITPERQPAAPNPCNDNNGNCKHLCLLSAVTSSGFTCVCPEGQTMDENLRLCVAVPSPSSLPSAPGSCIAAGHMSCCTRGGCEGSPSNCMCDYFCFEYDDCCHDIDKTCPRGVTASIPIPTVTHRASPSPTAIRIASAIPVRSTQQPLETSAHIQPHITSSPSFRGKTSKSPPAIAISAHIQPHITSSPSFRGKTSESPPATAISTHIQPHITSSLSFRRKTSESPPATAITTQLSSTPSPQPLEIQPEDAESFVSVGVVIGSLVAIVTFIILVGVAIFLVLVVIIKRMTTFAKYETFDRELVVKPSHP